MRIYVEAYDERGQQILGNLDGQRAWQGRNYKRTKWYKELATLKTLNNRVKMYRIVREGQKCNYLTLETVLNRNHGEQGRLT